jgi:DNA polymerase-3 subunit alpha
MDLFGDSLGSATPTDDYRFDPIPEYSAGQRLRMEKEYTGLCLSGSLLDDYNMHVAAIEPDELVDVAASFDEEGEPVENAVYKEGDVLIVTGILSKITRKTTKNGAAMAFVQIEDRKGEAELIIFPKQFDTCAGLLRTDNAVWVRCSVSVKDEQGPKLLANEMGALLTDVQWKQSPTPPQLPRKSGGQSRGSIQSAPVRTADAPAVTSTIIPKPASMMQAIQRQATQQTPTQRSDAPVAPAPSRQTETPAPRAQANPATVYLRVERMDTLAARKAMLLCEIFSEGNVQAVFYDGSTGKYIRTSLAISATPYVLQELKGILGAENVVLR